MPGQEMAVNGPLSGARGDGSTVVIGFAEAFAAIECVWSLQGEGYRVTVSSRRGARSPLRRMRGVRVYDVAVPEHAWPDTVADIRHLLAESQPAYRMPLDDAAVWVSDRLDLESLPDPGVQLVGPPHRQAELCLDKVEQLAVAQLSGLLVPPTAVVDHLADYQLESWPVVVKPGRAVYDDRGPVNGSC